MALSCRSLVILSGLTGVTRHITFWRDQDLCRQAYVNDQWRICFRFDDGDVYDVEMTDYH